MSSGTEGSDSNDEGDSDSEGSSFENEFENAVVNVDFEAFPPDDSDFHGIRKLLQQVTSHLPRVSSSNELCKSKSYKLIESNTIWIYNSILFASFYNVSAFPKRPREFVRFDQQFNRVEQSVSYSQTGRRSESFKICSMRERKLQRCGRISFQFSFDSRKCLMKKMKTKTCLASRELFHSLWIGRARRLSESSSLRRRPRQRFP